MATSPQSSVVTNSLLQMLRQSARAPRTASKRTMSADPAIVSAKQDCQPASSLLKTLHQPSPRPSSAVTASVAHRASTPTQAPALPTGDAFSDIGIALDCPTVMFHTGQSYPQLRARSSLPCSPISLVPSEETLHTGKILAVSDNFICYPVRTSCIRVLHRLSGARTLLKGHTDAISDVAFACSAGASTPDRVPLLMTLDRAGTVIVWQLGSVALESTVEICYQKVWTLTDQPYVRGCWCPFDPRLLVVVARDSLLVIRATEPTGTASNGNLPCNAAYTVLERLRFPAPLTNMCFSPDGESILLGNSLGQVHCYDILRKSTQLILPGTSANGPISFVQMVNDASSSATGSPNQTPRHWLIIGTHQNTVVQLWSWASKLHHHLTFRFITDGPMPSTHEPFVALHYDMITNTLLMGHSERKTALFLKMDVSHDGSLASENPKAGISEKDALTDLSKAVNTIREQLLPEVTNRSQSAELIDVSDQVSKAVHRAMQSQLEPTIHDTVTQALRSTVAAHLNGMLRDDCQEAVQSIVQRSAKLAAEEVARSPALAQMVTESVQHTVRQTMDELFASVLIPAYERSTAEMFRQMHRTFTTGVDQIIGAHQPAMHAAAATETLAKPKQTSNRVRTLPLSSNPLPMFSSP
ncbi:hypothetical protein H4R34_001068 [Dimargaris verticillata]|uniref:Enhancer of mRNA-decapping protein 4 WD40 repeat region domain-containing protein n=1 Tax=Dimargaris verticillata TaxID=2761393 RepID=A0A9W8BBH1_9FUNG|nr:hypothetical protein H4R34_001068 [Dimargaris verticillata]